MAPPRNIYAKFRPLSHLCPLNLPFDTFILKSRIFKRKQLKYGNMMRPDELKKADCVIHNVPGKVFFTQQSIQV